MVESIKVGYEPNCISYVNAFQLSSYLRRGITGNCPNKGNTNKVNQSNLFIKPFLHQLMSLSAVQKPSLKPQTASNAGVEAP